MRRGTGGLLLVACLTACSTAPGVTVRDARSDDSPTTDSTVPATTQPPETVPDTVPRDTSPATEPTETTETTETTAPPSTDPNGIGDVLFPALGNPGIDVEHYVVRLDYDPQRDRVAATVHLDVVMTEDRSVFSLDSAGPVVSAVTIDGAPASFTAATPELLITPAAPLVKGQRIGVDVAYTVDPAPVASAAGQQVGWFNTPGGSYVLDEPEGTRTWLPCDDHPSDQATFRFEVTVPSGITAVANGANVDHTSTATTDTWVWQEDRPMATYLVQLLTGDYEIVDGVGPNGLPLLSVVLRKDRQTMQPFLDHIIEQIDYFDDFFGPYPLDRYGVAITDSTPGLAMETLGRSLFSRDDFSAGRLDLYQELLLSHELSHQWFGDAVSPARWIDIWLNESFATYAQWMWLDHLHMTSIDDSARAALAAREPGATGRPTAADMFAFNSYDGGAVVLQALRKTIGDDQFFTVLRRWVAENTGTARTTDDFIRLAEEVSAKDLTEFFDTWLYADVVPTTFPV